MVSLILLFFVSCDIDPYIVGQIESPEAFKNALEEGKDSIVLKSGSYSFDDDLRISKSSRIYVNGSCANISFASGKGIVVDESVADGNVRFEDLNIDGKLLVNGGGSKSIELVNTRIKDVEMAKDISSGGEMPRLELESSSIEGILLVTKNAYVELLDEKSKINSTIVDENVEAYIVGCIEELGDISSSKGKITEVIGGSGTESDPYRIKSPKQFKALFGTKKNYNPDDKQIYAKLQNDLVLDGSLNYYLTKTVLDGNMHSLSIDKHYEDSQSLGTAIFGEVIGSTIENLIFDMKYSVALIAFAGKEDVVLRNVIARSDTPQKVPSEGAIFVVHAYIPGEGAVVSNTLTLEKCINEVEISMVEEQTADHGIFVGKNVQDKTIILDSCENRATIVSYAKKMGVALGLSGSKSNKAKLKVVNFKNSGKISCTGYASFLTYDEEYNNSVNVISIGNPDDSEIEVIK